MTQVPARVQRTTTHLQNSTAGPQKSDVNSVDDASTGPDDDDIVGPDVSTNGGNEDVERADDNVCMMADIAKYDASSSLDDVQVVEYEVHAGCQPYVLMEADVVASVYADQRGIYSVASVNVADKDVHV